MRARRVGIHLVGRLLSSGQVNTVRIAGQDDDLWPPGTEIWELDGRLHRGDGPAAIDPDGYEKWYLNGRRHREGGPAIICSDGTEEWWCEGLFHREGGPAVIRPNGTEEYWEHGERIR